jgi:hypothetical protein
VLFEDAPRHNLDAVSGYAHGAATFPGDLCNTEKNEGRSDDLPGLIESNFRTEFAQCALESSADGTDPSRHACRGAGPG